jgi:mono/diheme cytochrome c family protein
MKDLRFKISNLRSRGTTKARFYVARATRRVSASRRLRVCVLLLATGFWLLASGCRQDMQDQPRYEAYESSKFFADGQSSRPYVEGTIPRGHLKDDKFFYQGKQSGQQQPQGGSGASGQQSNAGGTTQTVLQTAVPNAQGGGTLAGGDVNVRGNTGGKIGQQAGELQSQAGKDVVNEFPFPITKDVLNRGQERYQIFCSMCHGLTGYGDGMVVRRGFRRPPSYHDDRLRNEPVGHFFDVVTNGWGAMPDYAAQIPPEDRWAIIAYIRALQRSQQATSSQASPDVRARAEAQQTQGSGGARQ